MGGAEGDGSGTNVLERIGAMVPISPQDASLARKFLIGAGYRSERAVAVRYGAKVLSCVVMLGVGLFLCTHVHATILRILIPIGAPLVGYFIPGFVLEHLVSKRQHRLKVALPDALDLMVVCVEAGLGLDQAINTVSRELAITHKDLCDEFQLFTLELQAGKRRADALHNIAERTGQRELKQLTAVLVQTDRFGTSMADSLRAHADFMRVRRRQECEEKAAKLGIKIVFPVFFLVLPTMFIISVGPAILQIAKQLIPTLRSLHPDG